mmetsp:Transcript_35285/g.112301  ORF Transcript_35285/g.112301 Transcript_35285/m.112301 type:complete len:145 (-) Transcript_35285:89-523(-)
MATSSSALLHGLCADIAAAGSVSDEQWKLLAFVCPEALLGAAEILDHRSVQCIIASESRRAFHLVSSAAGFKGAHPHVSLPGFCTCGSFCHKVAARPDATVCKHELAALLSAGVGKCERVDKDDAAWANELSHRLQMAMLAHMA